MLKRIIHYLLSLNGFPFGKGAVSVTEIEAAKRDGMIDILKLGRLAKLDPQEFQCLVPLQTRNVSQNIFM
jgi:hypothetical protein|tara:strand:+ start:171 stop:380 length:210 start_codon:yes stop_codon:yes gene_type:complete